MQTGSGSIPINIKELVEIFKEYNSKDYSKMETVEEGDYFKGYTIERPGYDIPVNVGIGTIKGVSHTDLFSLHYPMEERKAWDNRMKKVRILEKYDDYSEQIYLHIEIPVINDRDFVQCRVVRKDFPKKDDILVIVQSVTRSDIPEVSGIVRGGIVFNFMRYRPLPDGSTGFLYIGLNESGGLVPNFIIKKFASKIIPGMMEQLVTLSKKAAGKFGPHVLDKIIPFSEA